jgi:protein-tyrosine phosphatase
MSKRILFLCTGNYYRSRYAEALFNHLARESQIDAVASSRGLKIDMTSLVGSVSKYTIAALEARGIHLDTRTPLSLTYGDLQKANLIVALKDEEHRPMIDANFPGWSARTVFWNVHDIDYALPEVALREIEANVRKLIGQIDRL